MDANWWELNEIEFKVMTSVIGAVCFVVTWFLLLWCCSCSCFFHDVASSWVLLKCQQQLQQQCRLLLVSWLGRVVVLSSTFFDVGRFSLKILLVGDFSFLFFYEYIYFFLQLCFIFILDLTLNLILLDLLQLINLQDFVQQWKDTESHLTANECWHDPSTPNINIDLWPSLFLSPPSPLLPCCHIPLSNPIISWINQSIISMWLCL